MGDNYRKVEPDDLFQLIFSTLFGSSDKGSIKNQDCLIALLPNTFLMNQFSEPVIKTALIIQKS